MISIAFFRCLSPLLILLANCGAQAQTSAANYPNRSIKKIVTVPPGGAAGFLARLLATKLTVSMGQAVIVENKAGASGMLASDLVAKANPDGYTLLQNSITTHGIGPHLYAKSPYDPVRDFVPVVMLARLPLIMTVNADVKVNTLTEFLKLVKQKPWQLAFASSGNGGAPHIAGELLKSETGANLLHVPYKGSGPAVADWWAGRYR